MAGRFLHRALALGLVSAAAWGAFTGAEARADTVTAAQRRAAGEFLAALAAGNAQAVAYAIHPGELDRLRLAPVGQHGLLSPLEVGLGRPEGFDGNGDGRHLYFFRREMSQVLFVDSRDRVTGTASKFSGRP